MKSIESFKKELSNLFSVHCDACVGFEEVVKSMSRITLPEKLEGKNANVEPNHLITYGVGSIKEGNRKDFSVRT